MTPRKAGVSDTRPRGEGFILPGSTLQVGRRRRARPGVTLHGAQNLIRPVPEAPTGTRQPQTQLGEREESLRGEGNGPRVHAEARAVGGRGFAAATPPQEGGSRPRPRGPPSPLASNAPTLPVSPHTLGSYSWLRPWAPFGHR